MEEKHTPTTEIMLCMATHPKMPNTSGHARGRVAHTSKDGIKTICNMLVDGEMRNDWFIKSKRKCQVCFRQKETPKP